MVFEMNVLYVMCSYVVIAVLAFIGFRHINSLTETVKHQQQEIVELKQSKQMIIDAYNDEIAEVRQSSQQRKIVIKEIVKKVKGDDEKCLNSGIPSVIVDKLQSKDKK